MKSAADAVQDFRRRLLRFDAGAEAILPAAEEFPEDPMVQLCAAALHLYGQTDENNLAAEGFLDRAVACGGAVDSGPLHTALRLWLVQRYNEAACTLEEITTQDPGDLLAAKFAEFLYYIMGQQFCGPRFHAHMERLAPANGNDPDYLSMASFARELCGDFTGARKLAERSLGLEARNPWAEHTLSHVTIRLGEVEEGERRLRAFLPQAVTCSRPIHSHTAWHLALFDVERLNPAGALTIFHEHIWGFVPEMVGEQVDAIALLWRLEMAGADVSAEWASLADFAERHTSESYMPFLTAHHAYALARAGRSEAGSRLVATAATRPEPLWREVGTPVVRAAAAFGLNRWQEAAEILEPVMPRLTTVGGSDAQDDLFRQTYFTALARSGRKADARRYWEHFNTGKKTSPLDGWFLGLA